MKWLGLVVLWAAAACGESVIVASEIAIDAGVPGDCTGEVIAAAPAPAVLELIIDTSQSMDDPAPNEPSSKWELTRDALLDAIEGMPEQTSLGIIFFPDVPNNSPTCFNRDVDVPVRVLGAQGSEQRQRIEDAFRGKIPDGGAPTHDAYQLAFEQLGMRTAQGERFMLLITDDYPTYELRCEPPDNGDPVDVDPLIMATGFAAASGVRTFVVGLPGSDMERQARQAFSRMAFAGGTALDGCSLMGPRYCHRDMTDEQDFSEGIERTLESITAEALSCSYAVPAPSSGAPEQLQVSFTPEGGGAETLARQSTGPCDEGWKYSDDGARIVLCRGTCEQLREDKGRITYRTGCTTAAP